MTNKTTTKTSKVFFNTARQDKKILVLLMMLLFSSVWMIFDVLINTRASQVQTWYRFVAYGVESYSRTIWTYSYSWALLAIIIACLHIALSAKLIKSNYREVAALVLGLGVILIIIANVSFNLILGLPR